MLSDSTETTVFWLDFIFQKLMAFSAPSHVLRDSQPGTDFILIVKKRQSDRIWRQKSFFGQKEDVLDFSVLDCST